MTTFIQLHMLTTYPPSNLNRDDLGRPKSARIGGAERTRISSQSLKRAWRTSDVFEGALKGNLGTRTKRVGRVAYQKLTDADVGEERAKKLAKKIAKAFGKTKKASDDDPMRELETETVAHVSPEEWAALEKVVNELAEDDEAEKVKKGDVLQREIKAADIAMFGRMLADEPSYNCEAAIQVAHAFTTHAATAEDDFFTAVDDLNTREEDAGAGHMGITEFSNGVFYQYVCIDRDLLLENLQGDEELLERALGALSEAMLTVSPTGKQNSFASRAYANWVLAERGSRQPRSLATAFLDPVDGKKKGFLADSIAQARQLRDNFDSCYGACADERYEMNVMAGEGSFDELVDFMSRA